MRCTRKYQLKTKEFLQRPNQKGEKRTSEKTRSQLSQCDKKKTCRKVRTRKQYLNDFNSTENGMLHEQSWAKTNIFTNACHILFSNALYARKHGP